VAGGARCGDDLSENGRSLAEGRKGSKYYILEGFSRDYLAQARSMLAGAPELVRAKKQKGAQAPFSKSRTAPHYTKVHSRIVGERPINAENGVAV
jgi:hypothetical protein